MTPTTIQHGNTTRFFFNLNIVFFSLILLINNAAAQNFDSSGAGQKSEVKETEKQNNSSGNKYRLLQSNGLLVETAYHQEKGELQHGFSFSRTNRRNWSTSFGEEIPLNSKKHQLSIEVPAQFFKNEDGVRGAGDTKIAYSYILVGSNSSRLTFSPEVGVWIPTGNYRKELGRGGAGVSVRMPISLILGERIASNTTFEMTFTPKAKNHEGERANLTDYEIGQSFVWFAKPKFNVLVEAVWEREQEVIGDRLRKSEREFYISPGLRWGHQINNFLIVPKIGFPIGIGSSRSERGIFFGFAVEQSLKKEEEN